MSVQNRTHIFGDVVSGKMQLNPAGDMVRSVWNAIPNHYDGVQVDAFQVMPDHFHGIILLVGAGPPCLPEFEKKHLPEFEKNTHPDRGFRCRATTGVAPTLSLCDVVHRFKTLTTKKYIDGVNE
jgi:putative transposase